LRGSRINAAENSTRAADIGRSFGREEFRCGRQSERMVDEIAASCEIRLPPLDRLLFHGNARADMPLIRVIRRSCGRGLSASGPRATVVAAAAFRALAQMRFASAEIMKF